MAATTAAPHPRIAELLNELQHSRHDLLAAVAAVPPEVREAASNGADWSVAQILEHLSMVEDGAGRLVSTLMKQAQAAGAFETDDSSVLGSMDHFAVKDLSKRIQAPERVLPTGGVTAAQGLERLAAVRERLVTALLQGSGLALGTVSFPHPLFGPLNGYQWVLTIALHERRHVSQLRRQFGAMVA